MSLMPTAMQVMDVESTLIRCCRSLLLRVQFAQAGFPPPSVSDPKGANGAAKTIRSGGRSTLERAVGGELIRGRDQSK